RSVCGRAPGGEAAGGKSFRARAAGNGCRQRRADGARARPKPFEARARHAQGRQCATPRGKRNRAAAGERGTAGPHPPDPGGPPPPPGGAGRGGGPGRGAARAAQKAPRGDFGGALADIERLPEPVRAPAAAWIETAKARIAAIDAAKKLSANALEALARPSQ